MGGPPAAQLLQFGGELAFTPTEPFSVGAAFEDLLAGLLQPPLGALSAVSILRSSAASLSRSARRASSAGPPPSRAKRCRSCSAARQLGAGGLDLRSEGEQALGERLVR
ncbi:hypothetical protein GCM10020219_070400 [Nonomuraea dietziae]